MANKNSNKISIKPMNNAAAIASTLGISAGNARREEQSAQKFEDEISSAQNRETGDRDNIKSQAKFAAAENKITTANNETPVAEKSREAKAAPTPETAPKENQSAPLSASAISQAAEMPLLIEIKRKFPGKELFILSLLYLQRNNRGLVQMTVSSMMTLYSNVFQDVIKDDTARRSLKRLSDAGFIKTTSIPGNNSGYIYEIGDLLEAESLNSAAKEEFVELTEFVKSRLNNTATA